MENSYIPLLPLDVPSRDMEARKCNEIWDQIVWWSTMIILVCSLLDTGALLTLLLVPYWSDSPNSGIPLQSTYSGLQEMYSQKRHESSTYAPVLNLPRVMIQVDSSTSNIVIPPWRDTYLSEYGTIQYNHRRLLVSPEVSALAQFHVVDFGMESCSMSLNVPVEMDTGSGNHTVLDVWKVEEKGKLNVQSLSWNTKPSRLFLVGSFTLPAPTIQQLPKFECQSGSLQTFEVSCRGDCFMETVTDKRDAIGLYLEQYQTL
ncbi:hypothetical protein ARMGADRAFT_972197 [Armillaria gallica]|uniref:Ubiquitin 3 binding protein But2 C-terminal domain-containing protein n=1 Tax=Armillaria gallica TaxID=47427 RepID=A0A2H3CVR9_ARMGA|nr:hypothetical protein ARMGADRAFT_972197 [Armillaria gallica]